VSRSLVIAHGGDVSYPTGGTNRVTAFASGLADEGFDVTLVVPEPDRELPERLADVELSPVSTPNSSILDEPVRALLIVRRAKRITNERDAMVQLEHSTLGGVGQLWGHREYVLDMHDLAHSSSRYGDLPLGGAVQRAIHGIETRAVTSAAEIVVVSENMRTLVCEELGLDPNAVTVIPNGYDAATVEPYRTEETVDGRVAFLGTLHPKLDTDAIFEIAELDEVEEMIVIGDGAKREELEREKVERGLLDLEIYGRLPDEEAFPLLARAEVAINPQTQSSLQEASSPVKLFYYAALGLPMVVTSGPSVAAELSEADAAEVVAPSGPFASRVAEVLDDDERCARMGMNARERGTNFSWERRVDNLAELYDVW